MLERFSWLTLPALGKYQKCEETDVVLAAQVKNDEVKPYSGAPLVHSSP